MKCGAGYRKRCRLWAFTALVGILDHHSPALWPGQAFPFTGPVFPPVKMQIIPVLHTALRMQATWLRLGLACPALLLSLLVGPPLSCAECISFGSISPPPFGDGHLGQAKLRMLT